MKKLAAMILLATIAATGCSSMGKTSMPSIAGSWTGYTQRGDVLTLTFSEDGTVQGFIMAGFPTKFSGKYTVSGATIDMFEFDKNDEAMSLLPNDRAARNDNRMPDELRYLGIIRFTEENTIQLIGGYDGMGGRPSDFGDAAMEMKR